MLVFKNKKINLAAIYLALAIICLVLFFLMRNKLVLEEGLRGSSGRSYNHSSSGSSSQRPDPNSFNPPNLFRDELIANAVKYVGGPVSSPRDNSSIIGSDVEMTSKWKDVYTTDDMGTTTPVPILINKPDTSLIINDSCSSRGFLVSDYAEDICTKYQGDYETINQKCSQLTKDNCNIPSCCVFLNGNKCVAGNIYGPTYLTEDGQEIDYNFYNFKNNCYGNCDMTNNDPLTECNSYADNSMGVSQACIVKIFNTMGCPNKNPSALINPAMVDTFRKSSRKYITKYLAEAVKIIKKYATGDNSETANDSRILCHGPTKICDAYTRDDTGVSVDCMVEMLTDANCPNKTAAAITPQDINKYRSYTKQNLQYAMNICQV
jgi:hypothetical protein